ncbi:hypothetical protein ACFTWS_10835 [Streptomyces sp. NPDC057027]|uniref:hypothetical protein n=1 Tax=Streptomyces sp. NPDC057027 TaxID=3346004 RepID=UPI0036343A6E
MILEPAQWPKFLEGKDYFVSPACQEAAYFASRNAAEVEDGDCVRLPSGREGFSVTVSTTGSVGRSVVPGIDSQHATASAKAEIVPKCTFMPPPDQGEATQEPDPADSGEEPPPEREPISGLTCGGDDWTIDPDDPMLPSAAELFTVRLTSDDE